MTNPSNTIIAIGASTGGTEAILEILRDLPPTIPGVIITQHMPKDFTRMYAARLDRLCKLSIKEAKNYDEILPGQVLVAPGDQQMKVIKTGNTYRVKCYTAEKHNGHRPSVDILFNSLASLAIPHKIGILLTGMGEDGALGLLHLRKSGGYTIGQDEASCVVYGMPKVAMQLNGVCIQAPLKQIASIILKHLENL